MILKCINKIQSPLIPFISFLITEKILTRKYNGKIICNLISFSHASLSVILNSLYLYTNDNRYFELAKNISTGYFIFDSNYIWNKQKLTILDLGYLYHHFAGINLINLNLPNTFLSKLFLTAELSNFPMYLVYHYTHIKEVSLKKAQFWKIIQKYIYTFFRGPILTSLLIKYYPQLSKTQKISSIPSLPLYFLGLFWTGKLWLQK
jgi:hypothetical protein